MLSVRFVGAARRELAEAVQHYHDADGAELAVAFRDEAKRIVAHARRFPQGGPVVLAVDGLELRHFLFHPRFPYMLIACEVERALVVFAVAHQRQKSEYWKPRLAKVRR